MLHIMVAAVLMQMPEAPAAELLLPVEEERVLITASDYFDSEEYLVGPGDQIWINFPGGVPFAGEPEAVATVVLPIGLDGILVIPGLSPVDVTGMTLMDLQESIGYSIRSGYGRLSVSSGLYRSARFEVPVTGQVALPGIITVNGLTRLTEALDVAGGTTATASLSNILEVTASGDSVVHNINDFLVRGRLENNPLMHRGSSIHVYSADALIIAEGALSGAESTGYRVVLEYIEEETAFAALQRAGGLSERAGIGECHIMRTCHDSLEAIPFDPLLAESSPVLYGSDRIVIPFTQEFINVIGQVEYPQPVSYAPGMNAGYYIGAAGGFTAAARQGGLKLVLSDGTEEEADLTKVVPPGATVVVPRVAVQFWQEYLTILTGVATVIISYQSVFNN